MTVSSSSGLSEPRGRRPLPDAGIALLAGAFVFVLLLALRPLAGVPMNDDFSYARTAEALIRTGHVVYNGWGSPLLLPQMAVGALLIAIFGFSYALTQWFGVAIAATTAAVLFLLARASGLGRPPALLVTALVALSPIYLGVAPSFMTDIPSLLLLLLALLALVRSLRVEDGAGDAADRRVTGVDDRRFGAAVLLGLIAGSNRQICWVAAIGAFLAVTALVPRARLRGALAVLLHVAVAAVATAWFDRQPYSVPSETNLGMTWALFVGFPQEMAMFIYHVLNMIGLFVFAPAAAAFVAMLAARRPVRWLLFGAVAVFSFLPIVHSLSSERLALLSDHYHLTALPYGQYFTHRGSVIGSVYGWDHLEPVLGPGTIAILVILGGLGMTFGGYLLVAWLETLSEARRSESGLVRWQVAASAVGAASVLQILVSLPWFAMLNMFDRYLVLQTPGLLVLHALQAQDALGALRRTNSAAARFTAKAVVALLVLPALGIALLGVTIADDYFATTRARATLYGRMRARGVPEIAIDAGFEFAADDQVRLAGHMNNPHVANPPGAYKPYAANDPYRPYRDYFPTLDARYLFSTLPPDAINPDLAAGDPVDSLTYRTPFPPGQRTMYVYSMPHGGAGAPPSASP